jgi:hypothetical protein
MYAMLKFFWGEEIMNNYKVIRDNSPKPCFYVFDENEKQIFQFDSQREKLYMSFGEKFLAQTFTSELPMGVLNGTVKLAALKKAFIKRYKKMNA